MRNHEETLSPGDGTLSPGDGHLSPGDGTLSPWDGHLSPGDGTLSPGDGHLSPGDLSSLPDAAGPASAVDLAPDVRRALPPVDVLFPVDPAVLVRLHTRLEARADAAGFLDVAYRTLDTPIGTLLLAATEEGLVRVAFECEGFDGVLASLAARVSPRVLTATSRLDAAARELDEYFATTRRAFDLRLDRRLSTGFRAAVQAALPQIEYGRTLSYRQVAALVGNPGAVRAVGSACATNPLPIVVPCHRVRRSDGSLGGYAGGLAAKAALLDLERGADS